MMMEKERIGTEMKVEKETWRLIEKYVGKENEKYITL